MNSAAAVRAQVERTLGFSSPLQFREMPAPETVPTGIEEIDALGLGIPRGSLTEITGSASSGRTSLLFSILAQACQRHEACALVDAGNTFDPASASQSGINLERLLWIRCQDSSQSPLLNSQKRLERALKVTDWLLQSGGFGIVAMDLGDIAEEWLRRIPLTSWFRFRRAVEHTPTALLVLEPHSLAKSCASLLICLQRIFPEIRATPGPGAFAPAHACIVQGISVQAEIAGRLMRRKPAASVSVQFSVPASWRSETKPARRQELTAECSLLSA